MTLSYTPSQFDYELLDSGNQRRLERFGEFVLDRPAPQAVWAKTISEEFWQNAHARFDRHHPHKSEWVFSSPLPASWKIKLHSLTVELKTTQNSQLGIFPEQWDNWLWMHNSLKANLQPTRVLNLFGYTGIATLMASSAGEHVSVCHVDASKTSVEWAKNNAKLSALSQNTVRWIVDDVSKFIQREIKRKKTYEAIILDPPAFGRSKNSTWKFERDLDELLESLNAILSPDSQFVILSCHAPEWTSQKLALSLNKLSVFKNNKAECLDLTIPSSKGRDLPSSLCARISK